MNTPRRDAAVPLRREVEAVWDRLRVEFSLHDGFWLAFLFGAEPSVTAELVARTRDLARSRVRRIETIDVGEPADVARAMRRLLGPAPAELAATWVINPGTLGR